MSQTTHSPEAQRVLAEYRKPDPGAQRRRFLRIFSVVGLVLAAMLALYLPPAQEASDAQAQREDLSSAAVQVADPLQQLCAGTDETARRLQAARTPDGSALCAGVTELKEKAAPIAQSQTTVVQQSVPFSVVRTAVEQYCGQPSQPCRGADGQTPDIDKIAQLVLAQIPTPQDGKDAPAVTPAQILGQVAVYCGRMTEPCRGPRGEQGDQGEKGDQGDKGEPGESVTGAQGPPGRGIDNTRPEEGWQGQEGCWFVTTYTDQTESGFQVDPAMCYP